MDFAKAPVFTALRRQRCLPASVFGPRDNAPLAREARMRRSVDMVVISSIAYSILFSNRGWRERGAEWNKWIVLFRRKLILVVTEKGLHRSRSAKVLKFVSAAVLF